SALRHAEGVKPPGARARLAGRGTGSLSYPRNRLRPRTPGYEGGPVVPTRDPSTGSQHNLHDLGWAPKPSRRPDEPAPPADERARLPDLRQARRPLAPDEARDARGGKGLASVRVPRQLQVDAAGRDLVEVRGLVREQHRGPVGRPPGD